MSGIKGYSLTTGWGNGLQSLPDHACVAADKRRIIALPTPEHHDTRLRRATRECVLAVNAVENALANSSITHDELAGPRTALVYASASSYAAANWAFLNDDQGAYFPYTAPSAVPGEVTIQFAISGPYLSLLSGANAGVEALWHAAMLLSTNQCDRALILSVETFAECDRLYTTGRWLLDRPLVETAICLIIEPHAGLANIGYQAGNDKPEHLIKPFVKPSLETVLCLCTPTTADGRHTAQRLQTRWPHLNPIVTSEHTGTCLSSTALIGLLLSLTACSSENVILMSRWWDAWTVLRWPAGQPQRLSP